jgi:hypothetical protein
MDSNGQIINLFQDWHRRLSLVGYGSHSGRRTFIANASRKVSTVGGSLRDALAFVGHASLQATFRCIVTDCAAQAKLVNLV